MKKKVIIVAPTDTSAFSICILIDLLKMSKIEVSGVIVKKITYKRFINEWKRDGTRLLIKVFNKLILKEKNIKFKSYIPTAKDRISTQKKYALSLKKICYNHKIKYRLIPDLNSEESITFLKEIKPDLCIFTGGGILRNNFLVNSGKGVLNCHIGLLPEFKGMDVIEWPFLIDYFSPKLGMTAHLMDKGVDTGPIIKTSSLSFKGCSTIQHLRITLEGIKLNLINDVIKDFIEDNLKTLHQNTSEGKQYYVMHNKLLKIAKNNATKYLKKQYSNETTVSTIK